MDVFFMSFNFGTLIAGTDYFVSSAKASSRNPRYRTKSYKSYLVSSSVLCNVVEQNVSRTLL
jgi:hypothetical protein